jgi:hypothetical protein
MLLSRTTTRRCITKLALTVTVLSVAMLAVSSVAVADPPTRGDAQATFEAFSTGGSAIRFHNPLAKGRPGVEPLSPDSARIFALFDNVAYCQEGWRVIVLGFFDDPSFYSSRNELRAYLSSLSMEFVLDGVPLEVETTSVKEFPHPPPELSLNPLMEVNFGAFLAPGALSLGTHELQTIFHDPVFGDDEVTVSFTAVAC